MKINGRQLPEMEPQGTTSGNGYAKITDEERSAIMAENERRGLSHLIAERNESARPRTPFRKL